VIDFRLSGCVNLSGKGIVHIINEFKLLKNLIYIRLEADASKFD